MTLEVGEKAGRLPPSPEQEMLRERTDELREWLLHLEGWVEMQMAATRALVAHLTDRPELPAGNRANGTRRRAS